MMGSLTSSNLSFPYFNFSGGGPVKKTPCIMTIWWSSYEDILMIISCQDHILTENIWSKTAYSGESFTNARQTKERKREDKATQPKAEFCHSRCSNPDQSLKTFRGNWAYWCFKLFIPTFQYFNTDLSAVSVTFRNSKHGSIIKDFQGKLSTLAGRKISVGVAGLAPALSLVTNTSISC